jgi:3-ketosteroid 9alpha-monooxygenase subunit B
VVEVIVETADARSFVLEVPDELAGRFRYRAGQFLTVRVPLPGGDFAARCYSLSSSPVSVEPAGARPSSALPPFSSSIVSNSWPRLTITVKRMAGGIGSNWLCDHVTVGSVLELLPPAGNFTPRTWDADLLLLAAGSGITPVMSILRTALAAGSGRVVLVYANRDESSVIFAAELDRLVAAHPDRLDVVHWWESRQGLPTAAALRELIAGQADHELYVCGPEPFMAQAIDAAKQLGVPHGRIHVERFVSLLEDPFTVGELASDPGIRPVAEPAETPVTDPVGRLEVDLDGEHHELPWPAQARMLDVLADHGLSAPFSCRQGQCGACTCRLEQGEVRMVENHVLDAEDLAEGYILACQSLPLTETVRISYD